MARMEEETKEEKKEETEKEKGEEKGPLFHHRVHAAHGSMSPSFNTHRKTPTHTHTQAGTQARTTMLRRSMVPVWIGMASATGPWPVASTNIPTAANPNTTLRIMKKALPHRPYSEATPRRLARCAGYARTVADATPRAPPAAAYATHSPPLLMD